jgi:thioredoxin reductase
VTLSYRGHAWSRAREKNRARIQAAEASGRVRVLLNSQVMRITPDDVTIEQEGHAITLPNDAVIVCAGGILPTAFLQKIGVAVETKYGTA